MSGRKPCKECPWTQTNPHSEGWRGYTEKMEKEGYIKNKKHACHMITSDTWGLQNGITEENYCIGSQTTNKNG